MLLFCWGGGGGDTSGPVWMQLPTYSLINDKLTKTHCSRVSVGGGGGGGGYVVSQQLVGGFQEDLLCVYMHVCVNM